MKSFIDLIELVKKQEKKTVAVAAAEDHEVLEAVIFAHKQNLAKFILYANEEKLAKVITEHNLQLPKDVIVINADNSIIAAQMAVKCVNQGKADVLMKGLVDTSIILKEVLNKEYGLRTNSILSHVTVIELPRLKRILFITDCAMNIDPSVQELKEIINNATHLAKSLNFRKPKVAVLSAVEKINPKMPSTIKCMEVAELFKNDEEVIVEGPLALDLAINEEAAITKDIKGKIKGDADIIAVPYIEVGNALYKGWVFGAENVKNAGLIIGAKKPIVLTSRADTHEAKVYSIALSLMM
ncbi:MAG: phosphate acyltransferase [Bacilli bacterium]|nr:phosphate acyltransferase [Bacilli bacterium]